MDIDNQDKSDATLKQWKLADLLTAKVFPEIPQETYLTLKKNGRSLIQYQLIYWGMNCNRIADS